MRSLFIPLLILLFLTGCEDKEAQAKHDAQIAQQAREELLAELEAKKAQEKKERAELNKIGIHVQDGTIMIDTNKTKNFFNELGEKMDIEMKRIASDIEKGIIENKDAGVDINEQYIHIDLNKTRGFLLNWGQQLQVFVEEFDKMAKTLELNRTETTDKGM